MIPRDIETDPQIQQEYDEIMRGCPKDLLYSKWEMVGEYFKQFSIYDTNYSTHVTNCVN